MKGKGVKSTSKIPYYNISPEFDNDRGLNLNDFDWTFDSPEEVKGKNIYSGPITSKRRTPQSSSPKLRSRKEDNELNTYLTYFTYRDQITRAEQAERADNTYVVFIPKDQ